MILLTLNKRVHKKFTIRTKLSYYLKSLNRINPKVIVILLTLVFFILPFLTYNKSGTYRFFSGDIAEYLNNPLRLINGDLPYRDFWLLYPPGEILLPFILYKIFGVNINIILLSSILISSFVGTLSFLIGRLIYRNNFFSIILSLLIFFNGVVAYYIGHIYLHAYFLFLMFSVYYFILFLDIRN